LWFATRGNTFVYDGKVCTVFAHEGKPFKNVRTLLEDRAGNIWLAGNDGLWRYNGSVCTQFASNFTGYVYQDKDDNIWTSSETAKGWSLSRYDAGSLKGALFPRPVVTEVRSNEGMIFGILEARDGNIWFGTLKGVSRYDGSTVTGF
jgi:ligand-binding sensor domain-containing protein